MRLDKMLSDCGIFSRKECAFAVKKGRVSVNGTVIKKADYSVQPEIDTIYLDGNQIEYRKFFYYILNKPQGYVSATEDGKDPVVTELLPENAPKKDFFPVGRLDKNTTGLLLLTNDGELAHRLLSPKHHVEKKYEFTVKFPLSETDISNLQSGVDIGGYITKPCQVKLDDEKTGMITLTEGKYHQIKLMMEAVHNQITSLKRISFGNLTLDESLREGDCRSLTEIEIQDLREKG